MKAEPKGWLQHLETKILTQETFGGHFIDKLKEMHIFFKRMK